MIGQQLRREITEGESIEVVKMRVRSLIRDALEIRYRIRLPCFSDSDFLSADFF
jgi:hypothetical protein